MPPSSSNVPTSDPKIDEMAKMLKTLTSKLARLKLEAKKPNRPVQEGGNRNPNQFKRPNNSPHIMQREKMNHEDQRSYPLSKIMLLKRWKKVRILKKIYAVIFNEIELPSSHLTQHEY
jgi:hypothetical protein